MLKSGRLEEALAGGIVHINLKSILMYPYSAMSYTWATQEGDDSFTENIKIGEHEYLAITANCAESLNRIRQENTGQAIWVDMICIDQDNITERNHQVGLMSDIFGLAEQVQVYLGPGTPHSDLIFSFSQKASEQTVELLERSWEDLFKRRWFSRVWVLQEIARAKRAVVYCGQAQMDWQALETLAIEYSSRGRDTAPLLTLPTVFQLESTIRKTWSHRDMVKLLEK